MSSDLYFLLKPDAFDRGIWREALNVLEKGGSSCSIKIFTPQPRVLLQVHPDFCWDLDDFEDWISAYRDRFGLIGVIKDSPWSYAQLGEIKGSTFQPKSGTVRGLAKVSRRVSNILHTPANDPENQALASIFRALPLLRSTETVDEILSELDEMVFDLSCSEILERIKRRTEIVSVPSAVRKMTSMLAHSDAGSSRSKVLIKNLLCVLDLTCVPLSRNEREMLKQASYYPDRI